MLKTYQAIYTNGQIQWLDQEPDVDSGRIVVTFIDEEPNFKPKRVPSPLIAGKGKTLGDIVSPIVPEEDWECLK